MDFDLNSWFALISLIIASVSVIFAFFSIVYAHKIEQDRRYNIFYENIGSIYYFIHDCFSIISNGLYSDIDGLKNAERSLDFGAHKLYGYASVNKLPNLCMFSIINSGDERRDSKSFVNSLFTLETTYYEFRKAHLKGKVCLKDEEKLKLFLELFQDFDDLIIEYLPYLLSKFKRNRIMNIYYSDLETVRNKIDNIN